MDTFAVNIPLAQPQGAIDRATVQALGGGVAVAPGLTLPPYSAGRLLLLDLIDSPLLGTADARASMTLLDMVRALYLWHEGPAALAPVTVALRQREAVEAAKALADTSPEHLSRYLAALAASSHGWAEFDNAAIAFAHAHNVTDLPAMIRALSRVVDDSDDGFGLLPSAGPDAQKKTAHDTPTASFWRMRFATFRTWLRQRLTANSSGKSPSLSSPTAAPSTVPPTAP